MITHSTSPESKVAVEGLLQSDLYAASQLRDIEAAKSSYAAQGFISHKVVNMEDIDTDQQVPEFIISDRWFVWKSDNSGEITDLSSESLVEFDQYQKLFSQYSIDADQILPVTNYLNINPSLLEPLLNLFPHLEEYFGEECIPSLIIFLDPEEAYNKLFLEITLDASATDAFNMKQRFLKDCFSVYPLNVKSHLSLDLRLT